MRQIKFRGRASEEFNTSDTTVEKGDWVYGYFSMQEVEAKIFNVEYEEIKDLMFGREKPYCDKNGVPVKVLRFEARFERDTKLKDGGLIVKGMCAGHICTLEQTENILSKININKIEGINCIFDCDRRSGLFKRLIL